MMEVFEFPDELLSRARKITLADLLDAPFAQSWAVSMMANATNCSHHFGPLSDEDEMLEFKIAKICNTIPYEERMSLFTTSSTLVKKRQANKRGEA
jgi:hypothetical protein